MVVEDYDGTPHWIRSTQILKEAHNVCCISGTNYVNEQFTISENTHDCCCLSPMFSELLLMWLFTMLIWLSPHSTTLLPKMSWHLIEIEDLYSSLDCWMKSDKEVHPTNNHLLHLQTSVHGPLRSEISYTMLFVVQP